MFVWHINDVIAFAHTLNRLMKLMKEMLKEISE